jgi:uncharacterized membrane protein YfcA
MSLTFITILALLGSIGGFAAGLLGVGGGVLMFPLLYYIPPLFGLARLDARTVAAVVISQVFFSALVGGLAHFRHGHVQGRIALIAGVASAAGSLIGAVASKWSSERFLLILFGVVTVLVILMMFLPAPDTKQEDVALENITVPTAPLASYSLATGIVIGFLGAGNFIFVPVLIYILKVPTRVAIGSTLFVGLMNSATGFVGKLVTGQIPLLAASIVVGGATIGALAGERVHRRLPTSILRHIYATMVGLIAIRVWLTILGGGL